MGVVQDLYTLGFTYALSKDLDLRMASMHANSNSATGSSLRNGLGVPAGTEEIEMYEIPWALPGCCGCGMLRRPFLPTVSFRLIVLLPVIISSLGVVRVGAP